ncbi:MULTISPECIES: glycosyltransferase [Psychrilyobacter]|uniref:Glycosyltransferase n=1 Tax=Psychrilyobacter piezotolerans TaxID=2293438 RepID=A0ABX9KIA0_9FUSO|nr:MULTISPECIES: glycosyltransferase [Psychrilyobacter]MCS5420926.1 glycosyltransferase [Psychrilyobacter sp. S5]NDI77667.1 glycosyltransferase [Psychrilyobacter piezotolerans]RDE62674.1 glycosyltransferase [Psychrilyobacter sp. S5]REI41604.1 glycosyltransferase [Psychrilyobacter piezotolerans]
MKVALVNHNLGSGGVEKLIYDMAVEMKNNNIDVDIVLLTSVNGVYDDFLKGKGINIIHLSNKWDIYSPKNIFRLVKVLKKYDVVHTHIYSAQLWTAFASYLLPKEIKYITTEHSTTNRRRGNKIFRIIDRWMYSRYDKVVSITSEVKKELENWIGKNKNTDIVIENGIKLNDYITAKPNKREEFNLEVGDKILIMISRFSPPKDHATLIDAMAHLDPEYKLLLVGEGELKEQCINQVKNLKIEDRVLFLGYRRDVPNLLKMCDGAILSSFYEGLPISALEIMASGIPFIASDVPGLTDLVKNCGILFKQGKTLELKGKIKEVMENKKIKEEVVARGTEKSERYSIENKVKEYLTLYKN